MATTLETLKARHMAAADSRWEHAVNRIKTLLNDRSADVRTVTYRLLTAPTSTRYAMFGGDGRSGKMHSYPWLSSIEGCDWLEGVVHFVGHELLDDGDPGIGYMRHDDYDGFTPCAKDHEQAQPYVHRCLELLRSTVPDALTLNTKGALEILDWYEARRSRVRASIQAAIQQGYNPCEWDEDDVAAYEPHPEELALRALAEELMKDPVRFINVESWCTPGNFAHKV